MNELTITKETIGNEEINAIDARSLWVALGARRDFSNWIKSKVINNPFFSKNVDWCVLARSGEAQPRGFAANRKDYILSLDTAKKVAMAEQTEKGNEVRNYFIECEKQLQRNYLPQNFVEALECLILSEKEKEKLRIENIEAKPKVQYYDSVADASNQHSFQQAAKILGTGRNRLFARLRKEGILMEKNEPYQKYIDVGYFVVKQTTWGFMKTNIDGTTYITGKGMIWLQKRLTNNKAIEFKPY